MKDILLVGMNALEKSRRTKTDVRKRQDVNTPFYAFQSGIYTKKVVVRSVLVPL